MARLACTVLALALAPVLGAQRGVPPASSPADAAYQKLVAEFEAASAAYMAAVRELTATDEYKKAVADRDRDALNKLREKVPAVDRASFAQKFLKSADQFAADDRVPFLGWVVFNSGDKELAGQAVDALQKDHLKSGKLVDVADRFGMLSRATSPERANEFLEAVQKANPNAEVRAWAMYSMARSMSGRNSSDEDKAKAEKLLADAEVLAAGTSLADRIAAPRFEQERLQIGMEVPDIVGEDTDGTPFKLSDYRGKVVVLDFWGFW